MNTPSEKLCLLLAGANFDHDELLDIITSIKRMPSNELINRIENLRSLGSRMGGVAEDSDSPPTRTSGRAPSAGAVNRIVSMLRDEAGLSTHEATLQMADLLRERYPTLATEEVVRPLYKKSLAEWLLRVSKHISERDLLHIATILRNSNVHQESGEWLPKG